MPRLVVVVALLAALLLVGVEILPMWKWASSLPWREGLPVVTLWLEIAKYRLLAVAPLLIIAVAALLAGVLEGIYWRSKRQWQGYYRSLWECSPAPLLLALGLTLNWALSIHPKPLTGVWIACLLQGLVGFGVSSGYKPATTR